MFSWIMHDLTVDGQPGGQAAHGPRPLPPDCALQLPGEAAGAHRGPPPPRHLPTTPTTSAAAIRLPGRPGHDGAARAPVPAGWAGAERRPYHHLRRARRSQGLRQRLARWPAPKPSRASVLNACPTVDRLLPPSPHRRRPGRRTPLPPLHHRRRRAAGLSAVTAPLHPLHSGDAPA